MLIRITWLLVLVGLGLVIGGFLTTDSNVLLILAIAVEIGAIILVLASWARRAREATGLDYEEEVSFANEDTGETQEEELYAALEADEEFAIGGRRAASSATRRPARKKASSPASRSAAKAKPASARKTTAKSTAKSTSKPKSGAAKPKATRKSKPKAQGSTTRPKAKQPRPRPRPPSASP